MDLGIQEFRNCELLYVVSPEGIAPNLELFDFLRVHHLKQQKVSIGIFPE